MTTNEQKLLICMFQSIRIIMRLHRSLGNSRQSFVSINNNLLFNVKLENVVEHTFPKLSDLHKIILYL